MVVEQERDQIEIVHARRDRIVERPDVGDGVSSSPASSCAPRRPPWACRRDRAGSARTRCRSALPRAPSIRSVAAAGAHIEHLHARPRRRQKPETATDRAVCRPAGRRRCGPAPPSARHNRAPACAWRVASQPAATARQRQRRRPQILWRAHFRSSLLPELITDADGSARSTAIDVHSATPVKKALWKYCGKPVD